MNNDLHCFESEKYKPFIENVWIVFSIMCATGRSIQWIRTRWDLCAAIGTTKMSFFYYSFHNSLAKCNAFDISCAASMQRHVHNAVVSWLLAPFVDSTEIRGEKLNIEMEMEEWTRTIFVWCFCSFTRHRIAWWIHKMTQEGDREIASNPKKSAFVCVCVWALCGAQQNQWCPLTISEYTSH